jgi:hypothetical protein
MKVSLYVLIVIITVAIIIIIIGIIHIKKQNASIKLLHSRLEERKDRSIKHQRSTINGHIWEDIAPLINGFPANPENDIIQPLFRIFDYIIWKGFRNPENGISINFLDIKTGIKQNRTKDQIMARKAIRDGNFTLQFWNPEKSNIPVNITKPINEKRIIKIDKRTKK